jgi:hypothetical protein
MLRRKPGDRHDSTTGERHLGRLEVSQANDTGAEALCPSSRGNDRAHVQSDLLAQGVEVIVVVIVRDEDGVDRSDLVGGDRRA